METNKINTNTSVSNKADINRKRYFASANTYQGYESFLGEVFSPKKLKKVYILKGGPEIGKNYILSQIGKEAERHGYTPEYFYCSSNPSILEGILIPEIKTGAVNGSPPHSIEPIFSGIREIMISMAECWNLPKLNENAEEILKLVKLKEQSYKKATHFLSARQSVKKELSESTLKALIFEKLQANAKRVFEKELLKCKKGDEQIRLTESFSSLGFVGFHSFPLFAENHYFIKDVKNTSGIYFEQIYKLAKQKGISLIVSLEPENTEIINGLFFPDVSLSFTILSQQIIDKYDKSVKSYKIINMERFLNKEILKEKRQSNRFCEKCSEILLSGATEALSETVEFQNKIEKLYSPSTDSIKIKRISDYLIKNIF